jgi:hypothetical protein
MLKLKSKKVNYCTFWPDGLWSDCCYIHDEQSLLAQEYQSAEMRLKADQQLYVCVKSKGYTINAKLMYFGVRFWYWTKWYFIDGIK